MKKITVSKRFVLIVILHFYLLTIYAQQNVSVKQFPYTGQLPSNTVKRILQDDEGYMWFGTLDGLSRYDGYKIVTFRSNTESPDLLTENDITCLAEDKKQNIWIGTTRGLNILNKQNYQITHFEHEYVKDRNIRCLKVMSDSSIWIGVDNYIVCFNSDFSLRKKYDNSVLPNTSTHYIFEDMDGNIWLALWNGGLFKYNKESDSFVKYPKIGNNDNPFAIFQDERKQLWIGTWGGGLFLFDPEKKADEMYTQINVFNKEKHIEEKTFFSIVQDNKNKYIWVMSFIGLYAFEYTDNGSLREVEISNLFKNYNNIFSEIVKDKNGNLWVGTFSEGIINVNFDKPHIQHIDMSQVKEVTGLTPNVTSIYKDNEGTIWFNQNRWGLSLYYPRDKKIKFHQNLALKDITDFSCVQEFRSVPKEIWLCTQNKPIIYSLHKSKEDISVNYKIDLSKLKPETGNIQRLHEDTNNNIWVLTTNGIFLKPYKGRFRPLNISFRNITDITEDSDGNIWISSKSNGLHKLTRKSNFDESKIEVYSTENSKLKSNKITALVTDTHNRLWIGTQEGYIILYDISSNIFEDMSRSFKMIEEGIYNINKDNNGHIWVSTNKRLTEYNPENGASRDYSVSDNGMSVNSFLRNSFCFDKDGTILFGGNGGISIFSSSAQLTEDAKKITPLITNVKVNNISLLQTREGNQKLKLSAHQLSLSSNDRNVEIDFSSLNYSFSSKIQYAYKMLGVDEDWVYTGYNRQYAFYNQLGKGKHTFIVKATDENGLWNNSVAKLNIYKQPAFYETWWAYLLYTVLILLFVYYVYLRAKRRFKLKNDLRIAQIERVKSEELTQTKLRYFTNITHDFLTPLTIILCLIDDLEITIKDKLPQFELMRSNISRLRRLLQQILDFRKVESGNMKLKISEDDIIKFIKEGCFSHFKPLMKKKNISFEFICNEEYIPAYFDADKIDKIVFNLLSNAYKYTLSGGLIEIELIRYPKKQHIFLTIAIKDTGVGIGPDDLKNIFTRFYTNKTMDAAQTNGIGLSLTKDLVELHRGTIEVQSTINKGSVFIVNIPIDKDSYSDSEMNESKSILMYEKVLDVMSLDSVNESIEPNMVKNEDVTILLVEDNIELITLMNNMLSHHFQTETAKNGIEAINIIKGKNIDIIISDVMMPEMDGLELCRTLKSDLETSHIPIILLTAKSSIDDRIECYNAGADGYIAKPFDLRLLEARINNFLLNKKQKQRDFKSNFEVNISTLNYPSIDEQFLNNTIQIIEEHLSEPNFDIVTLARKLNVSKSSLYRKIKTLTDLSPSDFIRNIRLKHACQLLKDKSINISEVAYLVGFSDPKYFSTCFKSEFNIPPSEFQKNS